jgi:hypothetical protein
VIRRSSIKPGADRRSARQTPSREFYLINSEQKSGVVGCFYRGGKARKG